MACGVRHDPTSGHGAARPDRLVIRAEGVVKTFPGAGEDGRPLTAVAGVTFGVAPGRFLAITGPSGSGKSTLLHILGGIARPTSGRVILEGVDLATLDDDALAIVRRRRIGFVFQRYNLVPELTLLENVALPLVLDGAAAGRAASAALAMLDAVGIAGRARHRPDELSGGEQQRAAIARALVASPAIVLADEPTGALDSDNAHLIVEILGRIVRERGHTVVVVTHEPAVAAAASDVIRMRDGALVPAGRDPREAARPNAS